MVSGSLNGWSLRLVVGLTTTIAPVFFYRVKVC
jgi:hypothetical protein